MAKQKGQSILEYVIVLTVIVAAIAFAANSTIKNAVTGSMGKAATSINNSVANLP
jgi:hypothetical protein